MTRGHADWFTPHRGSDIPLPSTEILVIDSATVTDEYGNALLINAVLDADYDVFLRRIIIRASAEVEIFKQFDQEVKFSITAGGDTLWVQPLSGGVWGPVRTDPIDPLYSLERTEILQDFRVAAGGTVIVQPFYYGMPNPTTLRTILYYITEVDV